MSVVEHESHGAGHGSGAPPHQRSILMRPGFVRAAWCFALFFLIGLYLVAGIRWLAGWDPVYDWNIIVLVGGLTLAPIGFLLGLGSFDYWLYWISGRPTIPDDHANHGARTWKDYFKVNTDHKVIGVQYLVTTFVFFTLGGLMAMLFRAELAQPGMQFMDTQTYNGLVSMHAALMIFVFIIPAFAGLANFAVPLMLGAPDMAFPRLNALSFWFLPIAGTMFLCSFLAPGGAFATGWTSYAPLASEQPIGQVFFNMGVQWAGASSILTALNFLVTIITMRAPGMTFWRMPLLVWANFTTSLLVVIATPFIAGSQFFVMFDRVMHTSFFVPDDGGYVLGYQHIFWFYSHPAVYIMILPGFGIISEIISVMSRKPIFGYRLMAMSLLGILVLGFSVWAHHMFVAGMADWLRVPMMISTLLIAVPTGVKVFSWLATLWEGRIKLNTPMLFALGFISMFVIGGLSGIYLASVPITIHASDTYFIVAHIHYVLFGGSVLTIFAGIYYWFPKMTGRMYNERLGKLHFWLTFVSFNLTFFPMHWVGLVGMPRRVADYADRFADLNLVVTISSFALGASVVVFFYNMIVSWARGPIADPNPWRAMTLEWQVSSPPPIFNFDEIPQVVGGPVRVRRARRAPRDPHGRRQRRQRRRRTHERARRGAPRRRPPRATRREPELADPARRSSGCSCSSEPRRCCSARSSPPTSSSGSSTRTPRTLAAAPLRVPEVRRRDQHGDPRDVELHDALGAAVDQAEQPPRAPGRAPAHDPDGHGVPPDPVHRVRPHRVQHGRRSLRIGLLRAHGPARRPRPRRPAAAHVRRRSAPSAATTRPSTITASSFPGSTGTSST